MSILARILYFIAFWAYIAIALIIGFAHDAYIMAYGPMHPVAYVAVIALILGSFGVAFVCMFNCSKD